MSIGGTFVNVGTRRAVRSHAIITVSGVASAGEAARVVSTGGVRITVVGIGSALVNVCADSAVAVVVSEAGITAAGEGTCVIGTSGVGCAVVSVTGTFVNVGARRAIRSHAVVTVSGVASACE